MKAASTIVHISPGLGAMFMVYTAELESGGDLGEALAQRFLYVTVGSVVLQAGGKDHHLAPGGFAYVPQGIPHRITSHEKSRAIVIEKWYIPSRSAEVPHIVVGSEDNIPSAPVCDDNAVQEKCLLPDERSFDFSVKTMTYQPGAALSTVQMHVMEQGLVILEGGGVFRLGDAWHRITAGDFIWAGPWCPHWFGAIGKVPAKFLTYNDWNRHPLELARM